MFTILHISDLHRANEHYVSNDVLINSLEVDYRRYNTDLNIPSPQLVIVSGDIICGAKGSSQVIEEIRGQYDEAYNLLTQIANKFLHGDKSKVIIVPGNHDINWFHSQTSMEAIALDGDPTEQLIIKRELLKLLPQNKSCIRWSWENFEFYKIIDNNLYEQRFGDFSIFYSRFYDGTREYSINPENQYDIFDYPEFNVTVVGFNSCYMNDHCNIVGKIHPDCIAKAATDLRNPIYKDRVFIAVWHHNTIGEPNDSHYMDARILQNLIDSNFSIGLHGHQHKTEIAYESFLLNSLQKIVVISAGSLCAGPRELPTGETRKYNLIVLDIASSKANLYVRKMMDGDFGLPIWMSGKSEVIEFYTSPSQNIKNSKLLQAEEMIMKKEYNKARQLLEEMDFKDDIVRYLLLECYVYLNESKEIIKLYNVPCGNRETLYVIDALWEEKHITELRKLLQTVKDSEDLAIKEIYSKLIGRI